jgi:CRP-like cAMP-binding protein
MAINVFNNARNTIPLDADAVLFREGDDGDVMFAVVEGELAVERDGRLLEVIGPGEIIGELALIDPSPRSATVTAREPTRVVRVDRDHFTFLVHEHPTFALQVMTVMAERLRRANEHAEPNR